MKPLVLRKYTNKVLVFLFCYFALSAAFACQKGVRFFASHSEDGNNGVAVIEKSAGYDLIRCSHGKSELIASYVDFPVGVGYFTDINDVYYTMWMSATSYIYRIFMEGGKSPVFDMYTGKVPPTIIWCKRERYPVIYVKKQKTLNDHGFFVFDDRRMAYKKSNRGFDFLRRNCFEEVAE